MAYFDVCEAVTKVKKKYDEPNPVRLCRQMGITLLYESFGKDPDAIKGFFTDMIVRDACGFLKVFFLHSTVYEDMPQFTVTHSHLGILACSLHDFWIGTAAVKSKTASCCEA